VSEVWHMCLRCDTCVWGVTHVSEVWHMCLRCDTCDVWHMCLRCDTCVWGVKHVSEVWHMCLRCDTCVWGVTHQICGSAFIGCGLFARVWPWAMMESSEREFGCRRFVTFRWKSLLSFDSHELILRDSVTNSSQEIVAVNEILDAPQKNASWIFVKNMCAILRWVRDTLSWDEFVTIERWQTLSSKCHETSSYTTHKNESWLERQSQFVTLSK